MDDIQIWCVGTAEPSILISDKQPHNYHLHFLGRDIISVFFFTNFCVYIEITFLSKLLHSYIYDWLGAYLFTAWWDLCCESQGWEKQKGSSTHGPWNTNICNILVFRKYMDVYMYRKAKGQFHTWAMKHK